MTKEKKIIIILFVTIALILLLFGISAIVNWIKEISYQSQIEELKAQVVSLQSQLGIQSSDSSGIVITPEEENSTPAPTGTIPLTLGQKVVIDDIVEFTLNSCSWSQEVLPSNTKGSYTYYDDNEDETYIILRGTLTNISGDTIDIDDLQESEILVNNKYSFYVRMVAEDSDGAGFSSGTKPLQTVNFVIYASISDGVKDIFENATITLLILNDPSRINYYFDEDDPHNTYTIEITNGMMS